MKIHCFYNDLVLSLRCFFDGIVFPGGVIKNYQFNFGNRSIQLKYDTAFELPSIIINYRTSRPMFYHPYTFQHTPMGKNCNTVPVLYDYDKDLTLLLHEEHFEFNIEVLINCESQLSAIQIEHILQNTLILNKFLHFYKFYSFLEIEQKFMNRDMFDINNDRIVNLYQKYNHLNDTTDHCFAIQYKPLLRMDSVDVQMGSTEQRSFQVVVGLTMMNPVPVYLEIPPWERGTRIPRTRIEEKNILVSTGVVPMVGIKLLPTLESNPIIGSTKLTSINIPEDPNEIPSSTIIEQDFSITGEEDGEVYSGTIYGEITAIVHHVKIKSTLSETTMICPGVLKTDYKTGVTSLQISGPLNGNIPRATIRKDGMNSIVTGTLFGFIESMEYPLNKEVNFEFEYDTTYFNFKFTNIIVDRTVEKSTAYMLPSGNMFNVFPNINVKLLKPKCDEIQIKKVVIACDDQERELYPLRTCFCDSVGNFSFPIAVEEQVELGDITCGEEEIVIREATITGKINPETLELYYSIAGMYNSLLCENPFEVLSFVFDFVFESSVGYGARYIESINVDFTDTFNVITSGLGTTSELLDPSKIDGLLYERRSLLRTFILSDKYIQDTFKENDDYVGFKIPLDTQFNYDELISQNRKITWSFHVSPDIRDNRPLYLFNSYCKEIKLKERTTEIQPWVLEFELDKYAYHNVFTKVTVDNPVFFQIFDEGV